MPTPHNFGLCEIHWHLLNACLGQCNYCHITHESLNHILIKDRLFIMANRLLNLPYDTLEIYFDGGEPTLHPFLPDLLQYFGGVRRPMRIWLATDGSAPLSYYEKIFTSQARRLLGIILHIHPAWANWTQLIGIVAIAINNALPLRAILWQDTNAIEQLNSIYETFSRLSIKSHFHLALSPRCKAPFPNILSETEDEVFWRSKRNIVSKNDAQVVFEDNIDSDTSTLNLRDMYYCAGFANLVIEPDGTFHDTSGITRGLLPLWCAPVDALVNLLRIVNLEEGTIPGAPAFSNRSEADHWLNEIQKTYLKNNRLLKDVTNPVPTTDERLASALFNKIDKITDSCTDWIQMEATKAQLNVIASILSLMTDSVQKEKFFRALRLYSIGDSSGWRISDINKKNEESNVSSSLKKMTLPLEIHDNPIKILRDKSNYICNNWPDLRIAASKSINDFLGIVAWLQDFMPEYYLDFILNGKVPTIYCHVSDSMPGYDEVPKRISVVVSGISDNLKETLDHILAQDVDNLEIVLVAPANELSPGQPANTYAEIYPGSLHLVSFESADIAKCFNHGLSLASGEFIIFVKAGELLASGVLSALLEGMSSVDTEIAIMGARLMDSSSSSNEGLEDACNTVFPDRIAALHRRSAILKRRLHFISGTINPVLLLNAQALYLANRVQTLSGQPFFQPTSTTAHDTRLIPSRYASTLNAMQKFRERHALNASDSLWNSIEEIFYKESRFKLCAAAREFGKQIFSDKILYALGSSNIFLQSMICDYANLMNIEEPNVCISSLESTKVAPAEKNSPSWLQYGNAETEGASPALTIILPVYNAAETLDDCLKSIFTQSFADFEIIAVDDNSTDSSFNTLVAWADKNPRLRLFRMQANAGQGVARNMALNVARGKFIIFVDSDDLCMPGFFATAMKKMENENVDLVVFSTKALDETGRAIREDRQLNGIFPPIKILTQFYDGKFEAAAWSKIYRRELVIRFGCEFAQDAVNEDIHFFLDYVSISRLVETAEFMAYQRLIRQNSLMRPLCAGKQHLASAWNLYERLWKQGCKIWGKDFWQCANFSPESQIIGNLENCLLPVARLFQARFGTIPLSISHKKELNENCLFIWSLLAGFAARYDRVGCRIEKKNEVATTSDDSLRAMFQLHTYESTETFVSGLSEIREFHISEDTANHYLAFTVEGDFSTAALWAAAALFRRHSELDLVLFICDDNINLEFATGAEAIAFMLENNADCIHALACRPEVFNGLRLLKNSWMAFAVSLCDKSRQTAFMNLESI